MRKNRLAGRRRPCLWRRNRRRFRVRRRTAGTRRCPAPFVL